MALITSTQTTRPNMLTDAKDEQYHSKMARWCLNAQVSQQHRSFIAKSLINWSFYKGGDGQWIFDEDLESFFLDESGDIRNRIKITKNLIRPMVNQFIGNAIRIGFNANAKTTSDFIFNKRELELSRMNFYFQAGKAIPELDSVIRDRIPLGKSELENQELFDSMFDDNYAETINNILAFTTREINIEEIKVQLSRHLAITGIGIYKGYEQSGKYIGECTDPLFFIRDTSARKPDLSDSFFMGEWYYMDTPSIFERHQNLTSEQRKIIENKSQSNSMFTNHLVNTYYMAANSKIPVYELYWKDIEVQEYGYVEDRFGYPFFTRINCEHNDYTDKDLIQSPQGDKDDVLRGKLKKKIYVDVIRYCVFIPKEEVGGTGDGDIVLEWGELPYSERYKYDPSSASFPYKVYTWEYDKGEIISPIDDAINPQRFLNRLYSVAESHVNNARGTGTVVSQDAINPKDGEEGLQRNINNSKPIVVDTSRVGSVANAVGTYGSGINGSILNIFSIAHEMQTSLSDVTGINEAMTGTQGASDALVGVVQAQIQRGSLVQEPFYYALTSIMKQAYQHIATVGKRILYDNPRRAAIITGDGGYNLLKVTEDMMAEDFRVFIERTENEQSQVANANNLIFSLVQMGMIDSFRASMLFNRATPDMVAKSMREYQIEQAQAKREQSDMQMQQSINQQQSMQALAAQQQEMANTARMDAIYQDERNKEHDLEKEALRGDKKIERDVVQNFFRQE